MAVVAVPAPGQEPIAAASDRDTFAPLAVPRLSLMDPFGSGVEFRLPDDREASGPGSAAGDGGRRPTLSFDVSYGRMSGFVQVREGAPGGPGDGTRLSLQTLGLDRVATVSVGFVLPVGEKSDVRFRLRDFITSGSHVFADDIVFNGVRYAAGTAVRSRPILFDALVDWRAHLFDLPGDGQIRALVGVDFKYLDFVTTGTIAEHTFGTDQSEDFYRQALPLPSLGLAIEQPLASWLTLEGEVFGFKAIDWNSGRPEGGRVGLTQYELEAAGGLVARLARRVDVVAGVRYDLLRIDETSTEDGNHILMRDLLVRVNIIAGAASASPDQRAVAPGSLTPSRST